MAKYLFIILYIALSSCSSMNKSPSLIQATFDGGSSCSFTFRTDGSFEWTNGSGLGVSQTEGNYELKDHIIILDKTGFDKVVKSTRLLLTTVHPNSNQRGKYIVQVDNQNRVIDSMLVFTVYIDDRKLVK